MTAVFHQQRRPLRILSRFGGATQVVNLVIQVSGHLPAHEARRRIERAEPGRKARLKRGDPLFSGVQHDVEGFN
jgi:hypothetical protein